MTQTIAACFGPGTMRQLLRASPLLVGSVLAARSVLVLRVLLGWVGKMLATNFLLVSEIQPRLVGWFQERFSRISKV